MEGAVGPEYNSPVPTLVHNQDWPDSGVEFELDKSGISDGGTSLLGPGFGISVFEGGPSPGPSLGWAGWSGDGGFEGSEYSVFTWLVDILKPTQWTTQGGNVYRKGNIIK